MSNTSPMKTFKPYNSHTVYLLPPAMDDWLPKDHLAYFVSDAIDHMDLSPFVASYYGKSRAGQPPFHPAMMLKILVYAYAAGLRSSRRIARAIETDIAFRMLAAGHFPDFRTISEFRKRHFPLFIELFTQVVEAAREVGVAKLGHVAIDGSKVQANASKHHAMSYGRMVEDEKRLKEQIRQILKEAEETDQAEDRSYGADRRGDEMPKELEYREKRLERIQMAMAALKERAAQRAAAEEEARQEAKEADRFDPRTEEDAPGEDPAAGREEPERKVPEPAEKEQYNFTDPESRIMRNSDKAFVQAYNCQLAVDSEHQIISADAGYCSEDNLKYLEYKRIEAYIPPKQRSHREWRETPLVSGDPPDGSRKARMRWKLDTAEGRERYGLRKITVEPVFGQIKEQQGFRRFLLRGMEKAKAEWALACLAHNLRKMHRLGVAF